MNINVDELTLLIEDVESEYPIDYRSTPGMNPDTIRSLVVPSLIQQHEKNVDLSHDEQVMILLATIGRLTVENFFSIMKKPREILNDKSTSEASH